MKTQKQNAAARSRGHVFFVALAIGLLLTAPSGYAQRAATTTLTSAGMPSITITQGGSFTLTLQMTTNFVSLGYTVFLRSTDGAGLFQLTGRANDNMFFTDPITADAQALGGPGCPECGILNPSNPRDLGLTGDTVHNQPPGTNIGLATYTLANIGAMTPGVYHITLDPRSIVTSDLFKDITMGNPVFTVTVTAVPEPTTIPSLTMGGAFLLLAARRKHRGPANVLTRNFRFFPRNGERVETESRNLWS